MRNLIKEWRKRRQTLLEMLPLTEREAGQAIALADCAQQLEDALRLRPMEEAPRDEPVLVKHKRFGWIEAKLNPRMGWWESPSAGEIVYPRSLVGWLPLPEVDE